jgi:hypothetical protein
MGAEQQETMNFLKSLWKHKKIKGFRQKKAREKYFAYFTNDDLLHAI